MKQSLRYPVTWPAYTCCNRLDTSIVLVQCVCMCVRLVCRKVGGRGLLWHPDPAAYSSALCRDLSREEGRDWKRGSEWGKEGGGCRGQSTEGGRGGEPGVQDVSEGRREGEWWEGSMRGEGLYVLFSCSHFGWKQRMLKRRTGDSRTDYIDFAC